jgi:hypothetical protein
LTAARAAPANGATGTEKSWVSRRRPVSSWSTRGARQAGGRQPPAGGAYAPARQPLARPWPHGALDGQPGGDGGQVEADAGPPSGVAVDLGRVDPAGAAQGQGLDRVLDEGGERVVQGGADAGDQRLVEGLRGIRVGWR